MPIYYSYLKEFVVATGLQEFEYDIASQLNTLDGIEKLWIVMDVRPVHGLLANNMFVEVLRKYSCNILHHIELHTVEEHNTGCSRRWRHSRSYYGRDR